MLPKQHRLARSDYDLVFKKGRRQRGKNFGLIVLPADKDESCKIGIVVTKKVHKKAVDRNKLKRQIRNTINSLPLPSGKKIIISAFPTAANVKYENIKEEIGSLLKVIA